MVEGERTGGLANITSPISIFDNQPGTNITGKSVSVLTAGTASQIPNCPSCGSAKTWRDGLCYFKDKATQRWICRKCGFRFSEKPLQKKLELSLNTGVSFVSKRQICVQETKNLTSATEIKTVAGDVEKLPQDAKGLLTKFMAYLERENYYFDGKAKVST